MKEYCGGCGNEVYKAGLCKDCYDFYVLKKDIEDDFGED